MSNIRELMIQKMIENVNYAYSNTRNPLLYTKLPRQLLIAGKKYLPEEILKDFDNILLESREFSINMDED